MDSSKRQRTALCSTSCVLWNPRVNYRLTAKLHHKTRDLRDQGVLAATRDVRVKCARPLQQAGFALWLNASGWSRWANTRHSAERGEARGDVAY